MADLSLYKVDLDAPQPDGRRGESPRSAFTKYNDALDALRGIVEHIGNTPPPNPLPYMQWVDTSVEPAMLRRRDSDNTTWVEIVPALGDLLTKAGNLEGLADPVTARSNLGLGSAAVRASIGTGALYGRDSIVGTVSQSGGVPTGAIIERGSNANGNYVKFADGTMICFRQDTALADGSTWVYPAAFSSPPAVSCTVAASSFRSMTTGTPGPTSCLFRIWDIAGNGSTGSLRAVAIGPWY